MAQELFRKAALANASAGVEGCIVVRQPRITRVFAVPLLVGFVCALWFLAHMDYAHKVTVSGYLSFKKGLVPIISPDSAVITKVLVAEGEWVQKDTPLVELSKRLTLVDRSDQNDRHRQKLVQEITLVRKQNQAELDTLRASLAKSELRTRNLQVLQRGQQSQLPLHIRQLELVTRQFQRARQLTKTGALSLADLQQVESKRLFESKNVISARISLSRLNGEQSEQQLVTKELQTRLQSKSYQAQAALVRMQSQVLQLQAQDFLIAAPVAGRVSGLTALAGARVVSGQPLLSLLDESAELEAILFVPPRGSSHITIGQEVGLRYAGFPYQKFGSQFGRVTEIGRSLVLKGSVEAPLLTREPTYRIRVAPQKRIIAAYGKQIALTSGMLLEADLVHDIRPLWMWLLDPLLSLRGGS